MTDSMTARLDNLQIVSNAEEMAFSAHELSVLTEIATVVSAASSIESVYSAFAALVAEVIEWDGIIFTTPNEDGRTFSVSLREGEAVPRRSTSLQFRADGTLHGETMEKRETLYHVAEDGLTAELALRIPGLRRSLLAGFRSFLSTPLFSQGKIVGVISMQSLEPHAYSDHDRLLFERIAAFVGPTVGRFDAFEAQRRDDLRNKSLLRIGRLLLGARDVGDVFEQFIEEMRTVVEVDRLAISVSEPDMATIVNRHVYGVPVEGYEEDRVIPLNSLDSRGLDITSHGYVSADNSLRDTDPATSPGLFANYQAGLRSAMYAALHSEGRLVGALSVKSLNERAYGAGDLEYFEHVADHLAASIERTISRETRSEVSEVRDERIRFQQEQLRDLDAIRTKQRLVSNATRQLQTPLSGIVAFTDLLARNRRGNLDEKQVRYLSIIRRNAEDLSEKIDSLVSYAGVNSGQLRISLDSFEMAAMLREAVTDVIPVLVEQGQSADVDSPGGVEIVGDRRQLISAIGRLIVCASSHAPPNTTVRVLGHQVNNKVQLSVVCHRPDDVVPGAVDLRGVEEKVDTADWPEPDTDLTYVRAVAEAHGGDASYESVPDGGAMFTIRIPAMTDLLTGL